MRPWLVVLVMGFGAQAAGAEEDLLLQQRLRAHIEFLASDELTGREPGTGQMDQTTQQVAAHAAPAAGVPRLLPGLVGFPVEAVIEQVDPTQVGRPVPPAGGIGIAGNRR